MPSISVPVASMLAMGLGEVGVGAATAASIGSVAAPILTSAAMGAGSSALMGGDWKQGAMLGAVNGGIGELGNQMGYPDYLGNAIVGTPGATPDESVYVTGSKGYASGNSGSSAGGQGGGSLAPGGALSRVSGQIARQPSPFASGFSAGLTAAQYAASKRPEQQAPPGFDDPLRTTGYLDRVANSNYVPANGDWSTWGQHGGQPQFYSGNALKFAHGGTFETGDGEHLVRGPGDGTSDSRSARLSDGEYVLTAADVSRIGQGSTDAGAKKLDAMRKALARDAGATLHQKKTKAPISYLTKAAGER